MIVQQLTGSRDPAYCLQRPQSEFFASLIIGTLRSEDGDGSENVAEKVNSLSFNLYRDYSKSLTLSNVDEPS